MDSSLGGSGFVELCTGINLALASWPGFQDKIRTAQQRVSAKFNSSALDLKDAGSDTSQSRFYFIIQPIVEGVSRVLWHIAYYGSIVMGITGLLLLYFDRFCPWDFLLLLPSSLFLGWTWLALLAVEVWIRVIKRMIGYANGSDVKKRVEELLKKESKTPTPPDKLS